MIVGEAVLRGVLVDIPTEIDVSGELVIPEEKGIRTVGVAQGRPAGKHQGGLADVVDARSIGARNTQHIESKITVGDINCGLCSRDLTCVAEVGIDYHVGRDDVAHAESDILNAPGGRAGLATVEGAAAGRTEFLRVGDGEGLDAVAAEDTSAIAWVVRNLGVVGVAVIGEGATSRGIIAGELVLIIRVRDGSGDGLQKPQHRRGPRELARFRDAVASIFGLEGGGAELWKQIAVLRGRSGHRNAARLRIVEHCAGSAGEISSRGKITTKQSRRWNSQRPTCRDQLTARGAFEGVKEEELV